MLTFDRGFDERARCHPGRDNHIPRYGVPVVW
jgi:hypothetical protein